MAGTLKDFSALHPSEQEDILVYWRRNARSLFQDSVWPLIFRTVYGSRIFIFDVVSAGKRTGIIPLVRIRRNYVGLPFLDYTAPVCARPEDAAGVISALSAEAGKLDGGIVLRSRKVLGVDGWACDDSNMTLRLPLSGTEDELWKGFSAKVRNQVRKPGKNGVTTEKDAGALQEFYGLWARHISSLGTPVHSLSLFREVFAQIPAENRMLITARKDGALVGGLILLFDGDTAYVPWASSDSSLKPLCINHTLYWHAIREAAGKGMQKFDFLRSKRDSGTYRFKKQWGAVEEPLYYYASCGSADPRGGSGGGLASALWKKLPYSVALKLGPLVRRFVA